MPPEAYGLYVVMTDPLVGYESCAQAAECLQPDYIGIGPVYPTPTKNVPDPVIGTERLAAMLASVTLPHVCLGGVTMDNLDQVLQAGAQNFCAVRPLMQSSQPARLMREFQTHWRQWRKDNTLTVA